MVSVKTVSMWLAMIGLAVMHGSSGAARNAKELTDRDVVSAWATKFGNDLWELGQKMTKSNEIRMKYRSYNASVEHKGNDTLIKSIVENVGRMLQRKIDAVRCILNVAENKAEEYELNAVASSNYSYFSSKYSPVNGMSLMNTSIWKNEELPEIVIKSESMYRPMILDQDTHFYNISVNTTHSAVHVPTNVYDKSPEVLETLQWSDALDEVFVQNYNSDPALSWQYFGSDTGILRHYPAKIWESKGVDVYDCRKRSWYIETATCSKDIVILLDNSGSMTGFRNFIAQLTVKSVLDTFSNNDFINIYNFSHTARELVPCFKDTLVQATPENIEVFNAAIKKMKPEGSSNLTVALFRAFELIKKYRALRNCSQSSTGCNQAIMLITDGVPGNLTEVFQKYNWVENGNFTRTPVRIFTYLVGKEVTKVREIQWMACLNRGYYSHVQTLDEVQGEVLKYVTVIATPLVLQAVDHPPTWTHAFTDAAHDEEDENAPARLMIAVGVPAFDRKINKRSRQHKSARLLGVASTDVPVEDINKLTLPYKLGVNGYSFIVSNNGYVLLHPDLRPVEQRKLKRNYNSIDLTEVEQFDDGVEGREPGQLLQQLRKNLVNNVDGKIMNVPVKFHFDKIRRVSQEKYDYYYAPLPNTPFSLGLAIPSGYGNTWIRVTKEVQRNLRNHVNMSDFFVGQNWKVHPEWVYCKYHYLEGHEFATPEMELLHFLRKLNDPKWKWSQQYEAESQAFGNRDKPNCGRKTFGDDAYYCNKELVQLLVFDAKVTNTSYRMWEFQSEAEKDLIMRYNATLRFVATMSGLTRWQFIFGEDEVENDREFGDYHTTAIDETWYKMAIMQHEIDENSFVYSVPHADDPLEDSELQVTASHAIFYRDHDIAAPGSVVGFQFSHARMLESLMNISSVVECDDCIRPCSSDLLDCYVIDSNGYVVLSEKDNDTGRFFGEIENVGVVMESMVVRGVFKRLTVYDFQALCAEVRELPNDGESLINPIRAMMYALNWLIAEVFVCLAHIQLWAQGVPYTEYEDDIKHNARYGRRVHNEEEDNYFNRVIEKQYETIYRACDKKTDLFILQQNLFSKSGQISELSHSNCSRPYHLNRIPYSNLLLIVVEVVEVEPCSRRRVSATATEMHYSEQFPCYKLKLNDLPRRRLDECFTEHPDEADVTYCGGCDAIGLNTLAGAFGILAIIWSAHY